MHIDFTPAVLLPTQPERTSVIFHANEEEFASQHYHKIANPHGFAEWFKINTPSALAFDEAVLRKKAEPLPEQDDLNEKSLPLVALQLLKRWRNKCYDKREGRMPPSVMLAFYVASLGGRRPTLLEELSAQAENLQRIFYNAVASGKLVHVSNPSCQQDVLTDRWPANVGEEAIFWSDLTDLVQELTRLRDAPSMVECQRILSKLFGERATGEVFEDFAKRYSGSAGKGAMHHQLRRAQCIIS
jgi:hypothetical protein